MGVTVDPFRYVPPGPPFSATKEEKRDYPKSFLTLVWLDNYPELHEVLGTWWSTDTRLYDGHDTTIHTVYYALDTGRHIYTHDYTIPDPSEYGYNYWSSYRHWTCIGHVEHELRCGEIIAAEISWTSNTLPDTKVIKFWAVSSSTPCPEEVICTPGERKCFGDDLYECNSTGTEWVLIEAGAGICEGPGACPSFWADPVGAVICWILSAFEAMLGFVTGGFLTLQLNMKNFMDNYGLDIGAWLADPIGAIQAALGGVIATIKDVTDHFTTAIGTWWDAQVVILQRGWDNVISGLETWWSEQVTILQTGWDNIVSGLEDWWATQVDILQTGWDNVVSGLETWWSDQVIILQRGWDNVVEGLGNWWDEQVTIMQTGWDNVVEGLGNWWDDQIEIMQTGWDNVVADLGSWWNEQLEILQRGWDNTVSDIHDFINDTVPDLVSGMFEWAKPVIDPIINAAGFLGDIAGVFTGTYKDTAEYKQTQKDIQERKDRIKDLIESLGSRD